MLYLLVVICLTTLLSIAALSDNDSLFFGLLASTPALAGLMMYVLSR